jgi:serine protease inhibitor
MKKRITALLLALLTILALPGCGVRAQELTKDIAPQPLDTTTDLNAGGEAVTAFALSLLRSEQAGKSGVLLSPVSILSALGMVANGAGGDTLKQMETAAGMSLNQLNDFLYTYRMSLPAADKTCRAALANSAWARDDFHLEDDFLRTCVNYYGAEVYRSAFDSSLVTDLNRWVSQHTDGMIDQLLEQEPTALTMLYLVNAACFDARWETPYDKEDVSADQTLTAAARRWIS